MLCANYDKLVSRCACSLRLTPVMIIITLGIVFFVQQKHKHNEMAFLVSRNASKHILLALGVNCTARDAVMGKFTGVPI